MNRGRGVTSPGAVKKRSGTGKPEGRATPVSPLLNAERLRTNWERILVLSGDPWLVRREVSALQQASQAADVLRLWGAEVTYAALRDALLAPLRRFARPGSLIVVLHSPSADGLKALHEEILPKEALPQSVAKVVVLCGESGPDGRTGFAREARRQGRTAERAALAADAPHRVLEALRAWEFETDDLLSEEAVDWVLRHFPTRTGRVTGTDGQVREGIVADLDALFEGLGFCAAVGRSEQNALAYAESLGALPTITVEHLGRYCRFERVDAIWALVDAGAAGDTRETLRLLEDLSADQGNQGLLFLLASQLGLLLAIARCQERGIRSEERIVAVLSDQRIRGVYLSEGFSAAPECAPAGSIPPWKVRRALSSGGDLLHTERLRIGLRATIAAMADMRIGRAPGHIVLPLLATALGGHPLAYPAAAFADDDPWKSS